LAAARIPLLQSKHIRGPRPQRRRFFRTPKSRRLPFLEIDNAPPAAILRLILATNDFPHMKPGLTDTLCMRCGLCCDGSLFADVELASDAEASALEVMGLEIEVAEENDGGELLQPCGALNCKKCRIYPHRPEACRTFACRLLQEVERGRVGVAPAKKKIAAALKRIGHVQELAVQLGAGAEGLPLQERGMVALALSQTTDLARNRKRAELKVALASVERLLQATFLGG